MLTIALGIVLAVLILAFLPQIIAIGIGLTFVIAIFALIAGILNWAIPSFGLGNSMIATGIAGVLWLALKYDESRLGDTKEYRAIKDTYNEPK